LHNTDKHNARDVQRVRATANDAIPTAQSVLCVQVLSQRMAARMKRFWTLSVTTWVTVWATGVVLLQTSGCTVDETLLNELLEVYVDSLLATA
jgi:hypothetical protein